MRKEYKLVYFRNTTSETLTEEFGDWDIAAYGEDFILFQREIETEIKPTPTVEIKFNADDLRLKIERCLEKIKEIKYLPNLKTPNICHCEKCNPPEIGSNGDKKQSEK